MPITHSQLRAFHAVASEGSFTRAAAALHVTQPTLSAQVKSLEDSYGALLFDRRGRRVQPTELGREHNVPMPIAALVEQIMVQAIGRGWSEQGTVSLFRLQEGAAGITVRSKSI